MTKLPTPSQLLVSHAPSQPPASHRDIWAEDMLSLSERLKKDWKVGKTVTVCLWGYDSPPEALIKALAAAGWTATLHRCSMDPAPSLRIHATRDTTR